MASRAARHVRCAHATICVLLHRSLCVHAPQDRQHGEFLCSLRERWPRRATLGERVAAQLERSGYTVLRTPLELAERALALPHLRSSMLVNLAGPA